MTRVFVTGVNGLLGTNLVEDLLDRGFYVRGLIRHISKFQLPNHQNLELVEGGLFDDCSQVLKDMDVVIHTAAETRQNLIHYSNYSAINYDATLQLFNTAIQCGCKKFIFVSTANTRGFGSLADLGNEEQEIKPPFNTSCYAKSKLEAESHLLQIPTKMELFIINPGFMLGSYDAKPSSGKIILMGMNKRVVFYPPGGKNFVHVKDVSQGIINCMLKGKRGERYLVTNENLTYHQFFKKLHSITHQKPLMLKIPHWFLLMAGLVGSLSQFFGIKSNLNRANMRILGICNFYSNNKSITELGIVYKPIEEGIIDALHYFKKNHIS